MSTKFSVCNIIPKKKKKKDLWYDSGNVFKL